MKKILIALDYNPSAQKVAEEGYALAKAMNARAILLHVVADPTYYASFDYSPIIGFGSFSNLGEIDTPVNLMTSAERYLDQIKFHLDDKLVDTVVKTGDSGETILKAATDLDVDIIVMGTHSRRGIEKLLLGSVAEKVLHHSLKPVFIIPTKASEKS